MGRCLRRAASSSAFICGTGAGAGVSNVAVSAAEGAIEAAWALFFVLTAFFSGVATVFAVVVLLLSVVFVAEVLAVFFAFSVACFAGPLVAFSLAIVSLPCLDVEDDNGADAIPFLRTGFVFFADVIVVAEATGFAGASFFFLGAAASVCTAAVFVAVALVVPEFVVLLATVFADVSFFFAATTAIGAFVAAFFAVAFTAGFATAFRGAFAFGTVREDFAVLVVVAAFFAGAFFAVAVLFAFFAGFVASLPVVFFVVEAAEDRTVPFAAVVDVFFAVAVFRDVAATGAFFTADAFAIDFLLKKLWRTPSVAQYRRELVKFLPLDFPNTVGLLCIYPMSPTSWLSAALRVYR